MTEERQSYETLQVILYNESDNVYRATSYQDHFNESILIEDYKAGLLPQVKDKFEKRLNQRYAGRKRDMAVGLNPSGLYHGGPWKREDAEQLLVLAKNSINKDIVRITPNETRSFTVEVDPPTTFDIEYYLAE